jgi:hypothetical protein
MNSKIRIILTIAILPFLVILGTLLLTPNSHPPVKIEVNPYSQVLGYTDYGNVVKEGPYGNASSPVKVAIIVGVHPWEFVAHNMAMESIQTHVKSLKYCYYIYRVNVTQGIDDYETGRMNGQLLANKYVVPDIGNQNFQLVMDIHSNKGSLDNYDVGWFLNVPVEDNQSSNLAYQIQARVPGLVLYDPPDPTSPYFVTIPIIRNGTPAIIYESYQYDPTDTEQSRMDKVLSAVDNLPLKLKYPVEKLI